MAKPICDETLVELKSVPSIIEKRCGKKVSLYAVYRWKRSGFSGVKLECQYIGGICFTSLEALDRFDAKVTEVRTKPPEVKLRSGRAARNAHERRSLNLTSS